MKTILLAGCSSLIMLSLTSKLFGQGCVAIRGVSACSVQHADTAQKAWVFSTNYRYFKSFRHFRENHQEKERVEKQTDVRNYTNFLDLSLLRNFDKRWAVAVNVPLSATTRTSLYEHDGKTRHSTSSVGLGDVRFTVYRWMIDPSKMTKGNVQLGLGIKLATGDYRYQDRFYKNDSTKVLGPVDQSIQLGDGGTGFTMEANGYYSFNPALSLYGNIYYLVNPREQNGVSTARGGVPSANSIRYGSDVMSVPDQYMVRAGVNYTAGHAIASLGVRKEAIPAKDLVGGSSGFRRPGYVVSAEPGVTWQFKNTNVYAYVPVALVRNRTQSVPDQVRTDITKNKFVGDAAFADYSVNVGFSIRL